MCLLALPGCTEVVAVDELRFDCADVDAKSDEFSSAPLHSRWSVHDGSGGQQTPRVDDGQLRLVPNESTTWQTNGRGAFIYQYVCGDFVAVSEVWAYKSPDVFAPLDAPYSGGALMIRNPSGQPFEEWAMVALGWQAGNQVQGVDTRYTRRSSNGDFDFGGQATAGGNVATLLVCRVGDALRFAFAQPTQPWQDITEVVQGTPGYDEFPFPVFPDLVQVGVTATRTAMSPAVGVDASQVRFARPSSLAECTTLLGPS